MNIQIGFSWSENTDGTCFAPKYHDIRLTAENGLEEIGTTLVHAVKQTCKNVLEGLARSRFGTAFKERVYSKYRIFDAMTMAEKEGKYFVLKVDAKDKREAEAVEKALSAYADYWEKNGREEYGHSVRRFAYQGEGGAK